MPWCPIVIRGIHRLLEYSLVALMLALVGSVLWQVLSRYLLGTPAFWTEELARFSLVWVGLLGAAYATAHGQHLALDIVPARAGPKMQAFYRQGSRVAVAIFATAVMIIGGGRLVVITWQLDQVSAALGLPMALVYAVVPLSGCLIVLFAFQDTPNENVPASEVNHG